MQSGNMLKLKKMKYNSRLCWQEVGNCGKYSVLKTGLTPIQICSDGLIVYVKNEIKHCFVEGEKMNLTN